MLSTVAQCLAHSVNQPYLGLELPVPPVPRSSPGHGPHGGAQSRLPLPPWFSLGWHLGGCSRPALAAPPHLPTPQAFNEFSIFIKSFFLQHRAWGG